MKGFNYKYYRSRYHPEEVKKLPTKGEWFTVNEASKLLGVSITALQKWYLTEKVKSVLFKNHQNRRIVYIDISSFNGGSK